MTEDICKKCGESDWGIWTSSSTGKKNRYCRNCRRKRAAKYSKLKNSNGGRHSLSEWKKLISKTNKCAICDQPWDAIPKRPDRRYKYVWTKDHIIPLSLGGTDGIENIQAVCYRCNSSKCNRL